MNQSKNTGRVVWLTGLSGVGKTTIANAFICLKHNNGERWVLVDGDEIRELFGFDLGHDLSDRRANAFRVARICAWLSQQGIDVVCSTMSLFHEVQDWNRKHLPNYFEVYLKVAKETLEERHPQKLYEKAKKGEIHQVIGVDLPEEFPKNPDLVIDNSKRCNDFSQFAQQIAEQLNKKFKRNP